MLDSYQLHSTSPMTQEMASSSESSRAPFSRFDLPGLNLPLNWQPCEPHQAYRWEDKNYTSYYVPASGEGKNLFRTALNDSDVESGYTSFVFPINNVRFVLRHLQPASDNIERIHYASDHEPFDRQARLGGKGKISQLFSFLDHPLTYF
jgi:hypothetical protein